MITNSLKKRTKNETNSSSIEFADDLLEICRKHILFKHDIWSYENEHRIIIPKDSKNITEIEGEIINSGLISFNEKAVSEIIFGINFSSKIEHDNQLRILKLIKTNYPSAVIKEARKNGNKLEIVRVGN